MSIAFVASTIRNTTNLSDATTDVMNSSGADLLVMAISYYRGAGDFTTEPNDNKGNTWTKLTGQANVSPYDYAICFWYSKPSSVGASHTFSTGNAGVQTYPGLVALAFSGVHATPFDAESGGNGASDAGSTSLAAGSITPAGAGELFIAAMLHNISSVLSAGSYTFVDDPGNGGTSQPCRFGYYVQAGTGTLNPTWSEAGGYITASVTAAFKPAAGGGTSLPVMMNLQRQYRRRGGLWVS